MTDPKPPKLAPKTPPSLGRSVPPRIQNQGSRSPVPAPMQRIVRSQGAGKSQSNAVLLIVAAAGVLGLVILGGALLVRSVNTEVRTEHNLASTNHTTKPSPKKRVSSPSPSAVADRPANGPASTTVGNGQVIGIPGDLMTYCAAKQEKQNWCWAACIQMVYSTQGIKVSQENIVKATLGIAVDAPGGAEEFMEALQGWKPSKSGRKSLEPSFYIGPPQLSTLTLSLKNKTPVILAVAPPPGQEVGHAVVITAVHLKSGPNGKDLSSVIIRDPAPMFSSLKGKRVLTPDEFNNAMWHIIVDSL